MVEVSYERDLTQYLLDAVVKLAVYDEGFLKKFYDYLLPKVFRSPRRDVIECVRKYWNSNKRVLGDFIFQEILKYVNSSKVEQVTEYLKRLQDVRVDVDYVSKSFGEYVKKQVLKDGIRRAEEAVEKGNFTYAESIVTGVFSDITRLSGVSVLDVVREGGLGASREDDMVLCMRSGIKPYDDVYGGFWEKEMCLVMGDTNVGKTFCMVHLGKVAMIQGKKVLHVTLETSKEMVWERYKMSLTARVSKRMRHIFGEDVNEFEVNVGDDVLKVNVLSEEGVKKKLDMLKRRGARLWLYQALQFGVRDLFNLVHQIESYEGQKPDVVVVDSPDQMIGGGSGDELRVRERDIYRRLLDFAKEKNVVLITTTQVRRGSKKKYLVRAEDVAEAYDKVRIVDTVWILNQMEEEREAGVIRIYVDKNRSGKAGLLLEGEQCLAIGQFILKPRKLELTEFLKEKKSERGKD